MPNQTAEDFAARMKFLTAQDFGGSYRPGLVASIANGTASADDMVYITSFIKALDLQKVATANQQAGIAAETSPENSDLLTTIGADKSIVQRANSAVSEGKDPTASAGYLGNTLHTIAEYSANSGDIIFPQPDSFAAGPPKAPDGSSNESIFQKAWHGILKGLQVVGNVPGFIYREGRSEYLGNLANLANAVAGPSEQDKVAQFKQAMGITDTNTAKSALGYNPNSYLSNIAFNWSHGESDFNNLGPVIQAHGKPLVDTALKMFAADVGYGSSAKTVGGNTNFQQALANYQASLNAQLQAGQITPQQYTDETNNLSAPDLINAYNAVDAAHVSFGRDLARTFINYDDHPTLFKDVSGTADAAWSLVADPTLVAGKAFAGIKAVRYGAESLADYSKLSRLYGVADKVTGLVPKLNPVLNAGAMSARRNVTDFLARNAAIRDAVAAGDHSSAVSLYAENAARHADLMPLYNEAQGFRQAWSEEEKAQAAREGGTVSLGGDVTHEAMAPRRAGSTPEELQASSDAFKKASLPAIRTKPIETLDEWVDLLANKGGLGRWLSGLSVRQARVLPGMMGFSAEARASLMGKFAANRVLNGANKNPLLLALAQAGGKLGEIDYAKDAGKIIASDEGEAYKTAFAARDLGQDIGGRDAASWLDFARGLKGTADATVRRLSSWLPTNHAIALNAGQASKDIDRFTRTFMSKDVAATARFLWDHADNEAGRRQIGRAIVNQVFDASGITRSLAGREWAEQWNAGFDELNNVRYGLGDSDLVPDVYQGEKRVALNLSQQETHLLLPSFNEMRLIAAKSAILGFNKPLDQIAARGMKSWLTDAQGNPAVWEGVKRMLASPSATLRYGLLNSQPVTRAFSLMKLGWLGTTSNMLRQFAEEYVGLKLGHHAADLAEGKRLLRLTGGTTPLIAAAHHVIAHFLRPSISTDADVYNAVAHSRLGFTIGERPLDDLEKNEIVPNYGRHVVQREVMETLGARQTTQAEGGVRDALDAHNYNIQTQRVGWRKAKFAGYTEGSMDELNADTGRKALAASYVNLFLDKDEPARRVLAYLMWNHAAQPKVGGAFLNSLDDNTINLMHELVPVDDKSLAAALARKPKGITPPLLDSIKDYVASSPEMARFRQLAEVLKHDESGLALAADDQVGKDAAIERYLHAQTWNVAQHVFGASGKTMHAPLVSDLLAMKTPSELELAKIPLSKLPANVIHAEFAPLADGRFDKIGEKVAQATAMGTRAFDHIVTHPMQRLERKPLFVGNYARAYRELQPFKDSMVEAGYKEEDAKGIIDRMALGRAMQDTVRYLDNPKVASQLSAVAGNFWLFYRAQEDFIRRWVGIVKERPETLRLAHMGLMAGVNSGMLYRDSDGNLTLSFPGSGAIIDGFLMAQRGLGIADDSGVAVPSAHDLTTQLNYLNPSLLNPAGFSATPMVTLPWNLLKVAIPGHDMLKADVDMAFNGQLGNGRSWWEQFMPTEINRLLQLQGGSADTGTHVGSAAATTILNASIAGQLNGQEDDVDRQHKIANLKTQTLGAAYMRALMAFVSPGPLSQVDLDYKDGQGRFVGDPEADASWRAMGIKNLHDEFLAMVQSFGFDKAMAVWQQMHPKYLPYTVGKTSVGASGANADPTWGATQWVMNNKSLFQGPYARVAAYFIPQAPGTFDQIGWNAMTQIGVRQHKDLEQYYLDIASKDGVTAWYTAKDQYDAAVKAAKNANQPTKDLDAAYATQKAQIKAEYPILQSYFDSHSTRQEERTQNISKLRQMVADPNVPSSQVPDLPGVAKMLLVLDSYNSKVTDLKGQRSNWATAERQSLNNDYEATMAGLVKEYPGLNDLYNGIFREMEQ